MNKWQIICPLTLFAIVAATVAILIGKNHHEIYERALVSSGETNETAVALRKSQATAEAWEKLADVVFTTHAVTGRSGVRLERPFVINSNEIVSAHEFEMVLERVTNRELALIESYAEGFNTNQLTNAASMLKQAGFRNVRAVILRWGMRLEGPSL